ncbi:MAG: DUF1508 domain-containing protein [Myxococcota bacterium]
MSAREFQLYRAADGFRWRLVTTNNRTVADGGEAYVNEADCLRGIEIVKGAAGTPVRRL